MEVFFSYKIQINFSHNWLAYAWRPEPDLISQVRFVFLVMLCWILMGFYSVLYQPPLPASPLHIRALQLPVMLWNHDDPNHKQRGPASISWLSIDRNVHCSIWVTTGKHMRQGSDGMVRALPLGHILGRIGWGTSFILKRCIHWALLYDHENCRKNCRTRLSDGLIRAASNDALTAFITIPSLA